MRESIVPLVLEAFEEDRVHTPGEITRTVEARRGLAVGEQSAGAVRAAIHKLVTDGLIVRLPGTPLRYTLQTTTRDPEDDMDPDPDTLPGGKDFGR